MKNHFPKETINDGFYQIPNSLWKYRKELNLTLEEIGIINCIVYHSKNWGINFKEELSDLSESTVRRKIKSLKDKGYLTTSKKYIESQKCIGSICDLSGLINKIEEIKKEKENEKRSNLTELSNKTVIDDTINNTNYNNTNCELVSIFISSLKENDLDVPPDIGDKKLASLTEREKKYLPFAGEYIRNEIEEERWSYEGKPMTNTLSVLFNKNRKFHFSQFCEELLEEEEEEIKREEESNKQITLAKERMNIILSFLKEKQVNVEMIINEMKNDTLTYHSHRSYLEVFPFEIKKPEHTGFTLAIERFLLNKTKLLCKEDKLSLFRKLQTYK